MTVSFTVGAEENFVWSTSPVTPEPDVPVTPDEPVTADTFAFSDGTSTHIAPDGAQAYEITTAEQLFGAMPTSGVVVDGSTGKTRAATFDWNGFRFDTARDSASALLTVNSRGKYDTAQVTVTLADNDEVNAAVEVLSATTDGDGIVRIVDARFRSLVVDPFEYPTFDLFVAAVGTETFDVELNGEKKMASITALAIEGLKAEDAVPLTGERYDSAKATLTIGDAQYSVTIPVVTVARTVADAELVIDGFTSDYTYSRFSEKVMRYIGTGDQEGQVIDVYYSTDTHMPTGIAVYNLYKFAADDPFEGGMMLSVTFEEGGYTNTYPISVKGAQEIKYNEDGSWEYDTTDTEGDPYYVSADGIEIAHLSAGSTDTRDYLYDVAGGAIKDLGMYVRFNALNIGASNMSSEVAYGDVDGITVGYTEVAPYPGMTKTVVSEEEATTIPTLSELTPGDVKVYVGARYVSTTGFDESDHIARGYKVLKDSEVNREFYRVSGSYIPVDQAVNVAADEPALTASDTYYMVYFAEYTLEAEAGLLSFDHKDVSYNYSGGVKRTKVNVHAEGIEDSSFTMPIYMINAEIAEIVGFEWAEGYRPATDEEREAGEGLYIKNTDGAYELYTPQEGAEAPAELYVKSAQDGSLVAGDGKSLTVDPFKLEGSLTDTVEIDGVTYYKYFPAKVKVKTTSGAEVTFAVTWSQLGSIRVNYRGGSYSPRMTVSGDGISDYNYIASGLVKVENRTATANSHVATGLPTDGLVTYTDGAANAPATYIDSYEFDLAAFRNEVRKVPSIKVDINGTPQTFDLNDADNDGFSLAWNFNEMNVNYLGGKVVLIAELTGPDGSTQEYEIPYLVTRRLVSHVESVNFKDIQVWESNVEVDVEGELGTTATYSMNAFDPSTQVPPTRWYITFTEWKPDTEGNFSGTGATPEGRGELYSYLSVQMPSSAKVTAEVAQQASTPAGEASMQIGDGQRIRIPLVIEGKTTMTSLSVSDEATLLPTRIDGVNIVWHGTKTVKYNNNESEASYTVTFTSPNGVNIDLTAETDKGRTVTYKLTPYIGAVIDISGNVLDWTIERTDEGDKKVPACASKGNEITTEVKVDA